MLNTLSRSTTILVWSALLVASSACLAEKQASESLTPLHEAARDGGLAAVQALLDSGGDVDQRHSEGLTPLMVAAASGRPEVVKLLIERGADVNAAAKNGATALLLAAAVREPGSLGTLRLLQGQTSTPGVKTETRLFHWP